MKKKYVFRVLSAFFLILISCRDEVYIESPNATGMYDSSRRFADIFDRFWQAMNNNYVYWDVEPNNYWNGIYRSYMPKFEALGLAIPEKDNRVDVPGTNVRTAYTYFREILEPLHDGHLQVYFDGKWFDSTNPVAVIKPSEDKVMARPTHDDSVVFRNNTWNGGTNKTGYDFWDNLIKKKYIADLPAPNEPLDTLSLGAMTVHKEIGAATGRILHGSGGFTRYLYFSDFKLVDMLRWENDNGIAVLTAIMDQFFGDLYDPGLKGIIIDVRGNSGGMSIDISFLIGRMISDDLTIAYTRTKRGPSPLDYSPWSPYNIPPYPPEQQMPNKNIPIVALCNDYSISCAELLVLALKAMPNGYVIGTKTWGALGPRIGNDNPFGANGGSFQGSPFWTKVIEAGFQTRGLNKENYDGIGIDPDETVLLPWQTLIGVQQPHEDTQLEAAITYIEKQINSPNTP